MNRYIDHQRPDRIAITPAESGDLDADQWEFEPQKKAGLRWLIIASVGVMTLVGMVHLSEAAGVRKAIEPVEGEMVLLRPVPKRTAYRPAPPSKATLLDAGPEEEVLGSLGLTELSDADAAGLSAGSPAPLGSNHPNDQFRPQIHGTAAGDSRLPANRVNPMTSGALGGIGGTVRGATAGIGQRVTDSVGIVNSVLGNR